MALAPERSRPLHNFTLPRLRWGNQRHLRCMNIDGDGPRSSTPVVQSDVFNRNRAGPMNELINRRPPEVFNRLLKETVDGNGIEAVREKLMLDLRVAADKMKVSMLEENESNSAARPWNLRTRRAACKAPDESGSGKGGKQRSEERQQLSNLRLSPVRPQSPAATLKSTRLRGLAAAAVTATQPSGERGRRRKFSVSVSRQEVESDFQAMAGIRPPRRPKKRLKIVQNQMDTIFPGLWLTEVTPDMYKVSENPEQGKA